MKQQYNKNRAEKTLQQSVKILAECEKGTPLDNALDRARNHDYSRIMTDILFNYFRNKAAINFIIAKFADKGRKKTPEKFKRVLNIAATQILFQSGIVSAIACDVAVSMVRKKHGSGPAGFINAVLRQVSSADVSQHLADASENIKLNIPDNIYKRWGKDLPEFIKTLSGFTKEKADMTFRVTADITEKQLKDAHCISLQLSQWSDNSDFYITETPSIIFDKKWVQDGKIYIQDPSTFSACELYEPGLEDIVLDLCSAPGGKTIILAEKMKGKGTLISSDLSHYRQKRTNENISSHNINNCHIIAASALASPFHADFADLVFLDVPCTNTGVFRRRPDVLWNFSDKKLNELVELQKKILNEASKLVKPSGEIIYSTCSIEKEENIEQINIFLKEHPNFTLIQEQQLLPCKLHDGAFAALLKRDT